MDRSDSSSSNNLDVSFDIESLLENNNLGDDSIFSISQLENILDGSNDLEEVNELISPNDNESSYATAVKRRCEEEDISDLRKKWKCDTSDNVPIEVSFLH